MSFMVNKLYLNKAVFLQKKKKKQSEPMKEEWIIQQIVWGYWLSSRGRKKTYILTCIACTKRHLVLY